MGWIETWSATTTDLPELPDDAKHESALLIAKRLIRCVRIVGGPADDPATWQAVAVFLGIRFRLVDAPEGERGQYVPSAFPDQYGCIVLNTFYPALEQCQAWVHEISHAILHLWIPPQLSDAADAYGYSDDPGDARHDIARRVERLVLG